MDGIVRVSKVDAANLDASCSKRIHLSFVPFIDDSLEHKCSYYSTEEFETYLNYEKPQDFIIKCETQQQLDYFANCVRDVAVNIDFFLKNIFLDLTSLERLNSIETIQLKSNSKITELWKKYEIKAS